MSLHPNSRDRIWYIASSALPGTPVQPYRVGIPGVGGQEEPYYDGNLFYPEDYLAVQQGSVYVVRPDETGLTRPAFMPFPPHQYI